MTAPPKVSSGRDVATAYDAMADTYDEIDSQPFYASQYATYRADLESRWGTWQGTVLDLGCGTGIHTLAVAAIAERVVGCDVSPALVLKAQAKLRGAPNAAVLVADAAALPFRDCTFGAVQSYGEPLSHIVDPEAAVRELARVVKPGGRVVVSVDNEWNLRTILHPARLVKAIASRGGSVRKWEFFDDQGRPVRLALKTFTHTELVAIFRRHGFKVEDVVGIHVFSLLAPLATDARGDGWRARAFLRLHSVDRRLALRWPWNRFGYSKIVSAVRLDIAEPGGERH